MTNDNGNTDNEFEDETRHSKLRDYLYNLTSKDEYIGEHQLDEIVNIVLKSEAHSQHVGLFHERCNTSPREKAFAEQWMKVNEPRTGLNYGGGILQDLFYVSNRSTPLHHEKCHTTINDRDRMIVATVVQWLGSNIGMSFLHDAFRNCGYRIEQIEK